MPDVFDSIQPKPAPPQGDIFDQIAPAPVAAKGDVFDTLPSAATAPNDVFDAVAPAAGPSLTPPGAKIEAAQPSVWQRIRDFFTGGIPRYSSRTSANPEYGEMTLISPKDALTPQEQKAHPVLSALYDFAGGMTSPQSVATLVGTGGLGELPGAAGVIIPRLVSAGFSAQTLYTAAKQSKPLLAAIERGDYSTALNVLASMGLNVGVSALGARHAVFGGGAVTGKTGKAEPALVEDHAVEPASPLGRNVVGDDLPPEVRIVDTEAAKQHVQKTDSIPVLPGMEEAVAEQTRAAGIRQAEKLTEEINRPPESIESAAGEMERTSPLFRGTAASPQSEMFGPTAKPQDVTLYHGTTDASLASIRENGITRGMLADSPDEAMEHAERRVNQLGKGKPVVISVTASPEHIGEAIPIETATGKQLGNYYNLKSPIPPERVNVGESTGKVSARFPPDVIEQALGEMRGAVDLANTLPKAGRYFSEFTEEEHPIAGRYKPREGERPGGVWYGIGSQKENITGQFPWFGDKDINASKIQKALDKGKGADYERIVAKVADHITRERASSDAIIQEYAPQLRSLAEQVRDVDPDLATTLADLADRKTAVAAGNLKSYIEETIADATRATEFSNAFNAVVDEAREASTSASDRDVDRPRAEDSERSSAPETEIRPSEVTRRVPTARLVAENHVPVVSRNEILAEAVAKMAANSQELARLGIDPSQVQTPADITAMLDKTAEHVRTHLDDRALSVLTFDLQKNLARELGMSVEDLLANKSGAAFNAEQATAARMLLHESQSRVLTLAKQAADDPTYRQAFTESLAQHKAIQETVRGRVAREAGRALGSFRIREEDLPATRVTNLLAKLPESAQIEAAKLLSKIDPTDTRALNDFIAQVTPSSTPDKLFEYYRNALLSSPHVPIVKGASEAAMLALEATRKAVAGGISKARSVATGTPQDQFASEAWWFSKGALQALSHAREILSGEFRLENSPEFERTQTQAIKGTLGKVVRMPSTILSRQTNLVYAMNYFGELQAQAARLAISEGLTGEALHARQEFLAANPTAAMIEAANDRALHGTFQQKLGESARSLQNAIRNEPTGIAKYLFPFFKTPINLVKTSFEYSPAGLLRGTLRGNYNEASAGLIGTAVAAAVAKLALDGVVTGGGPVDYKKRQTLQATGWQPYSIKIGNRFYSYHRWEPLGLVLGLVADAVHGISAGDDPEVTQAKADNAVSHIMRNVDDFPFLIQLSDLTDSLHGDAETKIQRFIQRQVASFIPAGVANIAQAADRTVRRPETTVQMIESRVPGLTRNVPAVTDISGKPAQRPASSLGGANPFPISAAKNDATLSELARLDIANEQPPKTVKRPGTSKRAPAWTLTPAESATLQADDARQLYTWLQKEIATPAWRDKRDDAKRDMIEERRRMIAETRYARVSRMRRQIAAGE